MGKLMKHGLQYGGCCTYDEPSIEVWIPLKFTVFLLLKAELTFKANLAFSIH